MVAPEKWTRNMPSKTPKQAKFMRAIAHGWTPSRMKSPPSRAVAQEFVEADRKYSGGFAENRYWTGGLAAMDEAHAGYKRGSLDFKWQEGGDVDYEENGMRRGGRTRRNGGGAGGLGGLGATESPYTYEEQVKRDAFLNMDIQPNGTYSTMLYNLQQQNLPSPEPTIAGATGPSGAEVTVGPRLAGPRRGGRRGGRGGRRNGGGPGPGPGPGPGGPGTAPPRIIPTDPASYIGVSAEEKEALKQSPYRDQLREHKAKIAATLGSARGGHVNYYQEGGAARAGHPEDVGKKGPNPWDPEEDTAAYNYWETRFHQEPPPPEEIVEDEVAEPGFLERWFGVKPEPANIAKTEEYLESINQARGGRVGYQTGGLAIAAPRGGVPPWIEPTGEPVQGYQFGGGARRGMPYRGVPPQRGMMRRGAGGDPRAMAGRMRGMAGRQRGMMQPGRAAPQRGGLAAMMQARQQQAGAQPGGGGILARIREAQQQQAGGAGGITPGGPGYDPGGPGTWAGRGGIPGGGMPGGNRYPPGYNNEAGIAQGPIEGLPPMRSPGDVIYDDFTPGGGGGIHGRGRDYDPTGGRGTIPPWKRPPGGRIAPPPGKFPRQPVQPGGPGGPFPGGRPPGGGFPIQGGARVPPNMRGYLQKMRMQNRPPSGPVGGGGNRVGMADQQGALARAMQKGTGRAPTSRRMAFGRGAQQ